MSFKSIFIIPALWLAIAGSIEAKEVKAFPIISEKPIYENDSLLAKQAIPLRTDFITQSPGVVVGTTHYDLQGFGSPGNRIAVCTDGSIYFAWTNGLNYPTPRHVYFNYMDTMGSWYSTGVGDRINTVTGAGFPQLAPIYTNRAAFIYDSPQGNPSTYVTLTLDTGPPGFGIFGYHNPPDSFETGGHGRWPFIAVSRNNDIHILMTKSRPEESLMALYYTRSIDGGVSWWPNNVYPVFVDSVMRPTGVIAASTVSNKVAIAYLRPAKTFESVFNNVAYIISENGRDWNFSDINMVTDYAHEPESLWALGDMDVIFDYNDNIHIVWNAQWITNRGIYVKTFLYHFSSSNDQIDIVAENPDNPWPGSGCDWGAWNRPMCKMSLGLGQDYEHTEYLFCIWTQFDPEDCSANGYANGDIYLSGKYLDFGDWFWPTNLTNSHTPNCLPGDCDNDNWASIADYVDDSLRIFYVNDKDAGSVVFNEGTNCENPLLYLALENPYRIDLDINNHANESTINNIQSYPNPFNARTTISFELKQESQVKLEIFDIAGRKVADLFDKKMPAGHHKVIWDAGRYASGVYYCQFSSDEKSIIKQMVLIK